MLLLLGALLLRESGRPSSAVAMADYRWLDFVASHRNQAHYPKGPASVTVVELNQAVLAGRNKWPLPPLDYALFLQALEEFRPAVVGIEPVLGWARPQAEAERMLANRALQFPKLVLGVVTANSGWHESDDSVGNVPDGLRNVSGDLQNIPAGDEMVARPTRDLQAMALLGPTTIAKGLPPAVPLLVRYRGQVLPTFTLQAALAWMKVTPAEIQVRLGSSIRLPDGRRIPIDEGGYLLVDPFAPARVSRLGFDDLLLVAEQGAKSSPNERINLEAPSAGGITLLGRTDPSVVIAFAGDGKAEENRAPIDWTAAALATIQKSDYIRRVPAWGQWLLLLGLVLFGAWLQTRVHLGALLLAGLFAAAYVALAWILYDRLRWWLPMAMPIGVLFGSAIVRLLASDEGDIKSAKAYLIFVRAPAGLGRPAIVRAHPRKRCGNRPCGSGRLERAASGWAYFRAGPPWCARPSRTSAQPRRDRFRRSRFAPRAGRIR